MRWLDDVTPWWIGERVACPRCGKAYELTVDDRDSGAVFAFSDQFLVARCMAGCETGVPPFVPPGLTPPSGIGEDTPKMPVTITVYRPPLPTRVAEGPSTELSDSERQLMMALMQRRTQTVWDEAGDAIGEAGPAVTIVGPGEEVSPYAGDDPGEERRILLSTEPGAPNPIPSMTDPMADMDPNGICWWDEEADPDAG